MNDTASKSEQAYAAVKARIVDGSYSPGYRLVLAKIAEDLGVSVVPVREAIRRLEAEGLVKFERNAPENRLPPLFVITLTTPPPKRPYSAEIPEVSTCCS